MNYQERIKEIAERLAITNSFQYSNTIVVGNNAIGKSDLLRNVLESQSNGIYFIDSVNRKIDIRDITGVPVEGTHYSSVVEKRKEKENFNHRDTFGDATKIESILIKYQEKINRLFCQFTNKEIVIRKQINEYGDYYIVEIGNQRIDEIDSRLSNGYQALIRLFAEIIFFVEDVKSDQGIILIEEIDEFLAPEFQSCILEFLITNFMPFNFIVTTHSIHLIAGTNDCNIIALGKEQYEIYDSNDFDSLMLADNLFERLGMMDKQTDRSIEEGLKVLLNHKIQNIWSDKEDMEWRNIKIHELTPIEQLLYKTIERWGNGL